MRKLILLLALLPIFAFSQTNFKWEKVDSTNKTKAQLYTDTKLFIAQEWKSAKNVIQNDDKDGGIILIKGIINTSLVVFIHEYDYTYGYTVTFKFKDNKFKIIVDNVYCERAYFVGGHQEVGCIEPCDNCTKIGNGFTSEKFSKEKIDTMMFILKGQIQSIVDDYIKFIKTENSSNGNW